MAMYFKLTDGTTTFDLLNGDIRLLTNSWAPAVAGRRRDVLAGSPFTDVLERVPNLYVSSTNVATALAAIESLANLLDQAARWQRGENVAPVVVQYSPNSAVNYLEAAVLGPPEGQPAVILPPNFVDDLYQNVIDGITLQFVRRGQWLDGEVPLSGETVMQGVVGSVSFTAPSMTSPLRTTVTPGATDDGFAEQTFLLVANDVNDIEIIDLSGTADGNGLALGGEFRQVSPVTSPASFHVAASGNMPANRVAIYGTANVSAGDAVKVRIGCYTDSVGGYKYTRWTIIDTNDVADSFFFGTLAFPAGTIEDVKVEYASLTGTAYLQIDYICLFNVANSNNTALKLNVDQNRNEVLRIDHRLLTKPAPLLSIDTNYYPGYEGNPLLLCESDALYFVQIGTARSSGFWRCYFVDAPYSPQEYAWGFWLRPGYLVPQ